MKLLLLYYVILYDSVHQSSMEFLKDKSDEQIVVLARRRNAEYFGDLVYRYQQKIFAFILSIVRNRQTAEDLTQQTFEKAFMALNAFNARRSFKTWLFTIAKNETFSFLRKNKRTPTISLDETDAAGNKLRDQVVDKTPSPAQTLDQKQTKQRVRRALGLLKPGYRAALSLYYLEELTYAQIAKTLGLKINTARTHIRRAKRALAKILQNETF